jgi:hypothetical protein
MSYANFLELVKVFDKNEFRDLFKGLGFSKDDELAIMLHYLKNNGLNEVVQMLIEKMTKIKQDNLEKEQFVEKSIEKLEIKPMQNEISEEILESPVSKNSENIENSQFTILNEETN